MALVLFMSGFFLSSGNPEAKIDRWVTFIKFIASAPTEDPRLGQVVQAPW